MNVLTDMERGGIPSVWRFGQGQLDQEFSARPESRQNKSRQNTNKSNLEMCGSNNHERRSSSLRDHRSSDEMSALLGEQLWNTFMVNRMIYEINSNHDSWLISCKLTEWLFVLRSPKLSFYIVASFVSVIKFLFSSSGIMFYGISYINQVRRYCKI